MKSISEQLSPVLTTYLEENHQIDLTQFEYQATRKEFQGDITVVIFPLLRYIKTKPVALGESIGKYLVENLAWVNGYNVVKGFLNLIIADDFFSNQLTLIGETLNFGHQQTAAENGVVLVE